MRSFKTTALSISIIAFLLAIIWCLEPQLLLNLWGFKDTSAVLARFLSFRIAALFLGFSVIFYGIRLQANSQARITVVTGFCIGCVALAISGLAELISREANFLILLSVATEIGLAVWLWTVRNNN